MRILGIDVGATSIKAVEVDSAFGRFELHEYHEQKIPPGTAASEAVSALVSSLPKSPDRIVVSLRTSRCTSRNLQLPTRDRRAIQASVGFELEDDIPFPIDQAAYDYSQLGQQGSSTHLHVVVTLRKYVEEAIAFFGSSGVDPDLVTTEAWAFRALLNRILPPEAQEKPVLVAHLGHERSLLYVHWRGSPMFAREIRWGGREITTEISKKYGVTFEQAETAKLDHGFVLPRAQLESATAEQRQFSDAVSGHLSTLLREIKHAELSGKGATRQDIGRAYLTGGTALLPGLPRFLEEETQLPFRPLQALSSIGGSGVAYSEASDAQFAKAGALALCLVGSDRSTAIQLRKGSLAKSGGTRELTFATLRKPLLAAAAVGACLLVSLGVQSYVFKRRIVVADEQLERGMKAFFGQLSPSAVRTYLANTSALKGSITQELERQRETNRLLDANPFSPLTFLKELSVAIPRDTVVDLTELQVGAAPAESYRAAAATTASLTFLVANPQIAEKLATTLSGRIQSIQRSKLDEAPAAEDGGPKRWKVTFTGSPTEDSYGR